MPVFCSFLLSRVIFGARGIVEPALTDAVMRMWFAPGWSLRFVEHQIVFRTGVRRIELAVITGLPLT